MNKPKMLLRSLPAYNVARRRHWRRTAFLLSLATFAVPCLAIDNIVLDRLDLPWINQYTVAYGADLDAVFAFSEIVKSELRPTFRGFTERLGTLVEQRVSVLPPHIITSGSVVVGTRVLGARVIEQRLDIDYNLGSTFGGVNQRISGSQWLDCIGASGCSPGTYTFLREGHLAVGIPAGPIAAPGLGRSDFDLHFKSTVFATRPGLSFTADSHHVVDVRVGLYREYTPKLKVDYIFDALNEVRTGSRSNKEKAVEAYQDIIDLRERDEATSAHNLNLRNAEYFLRGYAGGRSFNEGRISWDDLGNELGNSGGPIAAGAYNALKIARAKLGLPLNEGLPGTSPNFFGGLRDNFTGWVLGAANPGVSIEDILTNPELRAFIETGRPSQMLSVDPLAPTLGLNLKLHADDIDISMQVFEVSPPSPEVFYWFDPSPTQLYSLSVFGNKITGLQLVGDFSGDIRVQFGDHDVAVDSLAPIDLAVYDAAGFDSVTVSGVKAVVPPTFGLRFASAADTMININEISLPVPEPATWLLLFAGLVVLNRVRQCGLSKNEITATFNG